MQHARVCHVIACTHAQVAHRTGRFFRKSASSCCCSVCDSRPAACLAALLLRAAALPTAGCNAAACLGLLRLAAGPGAHCRPSAAKGSSSELSSGVQARFLLPSTQPTTCFPDPAAHHVKKDIVQGDAWRLIRFWGTHCLTSSTHCRCFISYLKHLKHHPALLVGRVW